MQRAGWFPVQRVEVVGARFLAPHDVLAASGIARGESVWTDPAGWEAALDGHPVVEEARVARRLPATLRIHVREKRPVALVEAGVLRPATSAGELLELDPARAPVDLPLLRAALRAENGSVRDSTGLALLAELGRLAELDAGLLARVSEVHAGPEGGVVLVFGNPYAEAVLPPGAGSERLRQLRAVLEDVSARAPGGREPARVDLRFEGQIVVRLSTSA